MNYIVELNGERYRVDLDRDSVVVEGGRSEYVELSEIENSPVSIVKLGSEVHRVVVDKQPGKGRYRLWIDGYRFDVEALDDRTRSIRDLTAANARQGGLAPVRAPMPGLIVRLNVKVGDTVIAGQGVVVMEAMKMENELRVAADGRVKSIEVTPGTAVEKGALLVVLD